jgi:hypothetical protein
MTENEIGTIVIELAIAVHQELDPGFSRRFTRLFWSVSCKVEV